MSSVTLHELESHLWESANILRGPVDAADFKTYIFPLLFFKRICDVWDEEYQEIVEESGDAELAMFPESHRFQIPDGFHWDDVRAKATNVGTTLQRAMREIEKANPDTLYGVFGDAQWSNKERLSDALLKDLIEHYSRLPLGNKQVRSDVLGDAYEYLIKKFADVTNKKAGEFYTPRSVVRLMIEMLNSKLRGCDLVSLRLRDVSHGGVIAKRAIVLQRKIDRPVQFELTDLTRASVAEWARQAQIMPGAYLFPGRAKHVGHLSTRQYARIVSSWVTAIGLDRHNYGTHSMRRTKASLIYRRTKNLRAVQILLGHTKLESTLRYLGIEVEDALEMSEQTEA